VKTINIYGSTGNSKVIIGEALGNLSNYLPGTKPIVITDKNVWRLYKNEFPDAEVIRIGTGEKIKTLDTVKSIYQRLIDIGADRSSYIVGIGGGVVCDIAGFVASTYMLGIRFGFVSSTLLSQVDASTGGKNGVNFGGYKNMVGVFHQPEFVICDQNLLGTLSKDEISCGFAEIVKHALIKDIDMFEYLEENFKSALHLEASVIENLIYKSVSIKTEIVNKDETEKGERRKLNFGHTFGHAIEKTAKLPHGKSVSIGIMLASRLSEKKGLIEKPDVSRIKSLLENLNLPTHLKMDTKRLFKAMMADKKKEGDHVYFVFIKGIGNAIVETMTVSDLKAVF
jgi:3-dehydroquinate synthase